MFTCNHISGLVGTAILLAAVGLAAPAAADDTVDAFIFKLADDGVDFSSTNDVLTRAYQVCGQFAEGMSPDGINAAMVETSNFTARQSALFMADAVQAFCPRYANQFIKDSG
jgi:Protein of unknown function (DUF732)